MRAGGFCRLRLSSPRPWRCFPAVEVSKCEEKVFSTSVEVFPMPDPKGPSTRCLLHVRGGVSGQNRSRSKNQGSSPRPWRCFPHAVRVWRRRLVFSTSVEVFQHAVTFQNSYRRLLHVRGGVSAKDAARQAVTESSPRPWRCFSTPTRLPHQSKVFSTSVEVFPKTSKTRIVPVSLLPVRGGVSAQKDFVQELCKVFSTSVEVFLSKGAVRMWPERLLHVRGGVSEAHD